MKNRETKDAKYNRLSHELALRQLMERFIFELEANANIFGNDKDLMLDDLIRDTHNVEVFTDLEYEEVYKKSLKEIYKK